MADYEDIIEVNNLVGKLNKDYVFHPYSMVKDHRTGEQTGNVSAVMDGELDSFIDAYLRGKLNDGKDDDM